MKNKKIGLCVTGSFCTLRQLMPVVQELVDNSNTVIPILSYSVSQLDTRFYQANDFLDDIQKITNQKAILTIDGAEPIGPKKQLDLIIVAPCTGNTLAKINNAITDTPVTMAIKAHLRNNRPVLIAIASNDALSNNFKNIGELINKKNVFFVPFYQDDSMGKPNSLAACYDMLQESAESAISGRQIQPIIRGKI